MRTLLWGGRLVTESSSAGEPLLSFGSGVANGIFVGAGLATLSTKVFRSRTCMETIGQRSVCQANLVWSVEPDGGNS